MEDMPLVGLRQFRERLDTFTGPVRVVKTRGDIIVLGIWVPEGARFEVRPIPVETVYISDAPKRDVSSKKD